MDIIQQTMERITTQHHTNLKKVLQGDTDLSEVVLDLEKTLYEVGRQLLQETVETLDEKIRESPSRKKHWHIEKKGQIKTLYTAMGPVEYRRTYYRHKTTGEYAHLSDEHLGIKPHERMDDSLRSKLLKNATQMSYERAVAQEPQSGVTSRMSVMNVIRRLQTIPNEAVPMQPRPTPRTLYIEADEDHVALQQGKRGISKIVYVHEGYRSTTPQRKTLQQTRYFTDSQQSSEQLWLEVAQYLDTAYDMTQVEKIFLSGDGASWIKEGLNWIPKSIHVLDPFHLAKYLRSATNHKPYFAAPLWTYLRKGKREAVKELMEVLIKDTPNVQKRQELSKTRRYIFNHWSGIQHQQDPEYIGCSAEGHVSHILSARLSSRPMGWSEIGMQQMSRMRVFEYNGGNVDDYIKAAKKKQQKQDRAVKLDQRIVRQTLKSCHETRGNVTILNTGKKTGTATLLKAVRGI